MLTRRIIPCLDVKNGRVVKGVNFMGLRDAGDPADLAEFYCREGADELVFLDITASCESRPLFYELISKIAGRIMIPFTIGGGIGDLQDIRHLLNAGADKVSLNTAALAGPELISRAAEVFGSQCVVCAIDAQRKDDGTWEVFTHGGTRPTGRDALEWARTAAKMGAGEILLTSMDADGTRKGFDIDLTRRITDAVKIPVIASGGGGRPEDFLDVFRNGRADAALAASVFHYGDIALPDLKRFLNENQIPVRMLRMPLPELKYDAAGLIPAIVQENATGEVLMMAYMNRQSLEISLKEGRTCFFSRSRRTLWRKGETSGNIQEIREIRYDCDADTLLVLVDQSGPACHTGERSCFYRSVESMGE